MKENLTLGFGGGVAVGVALGALLFLGSGLYIHHRTRNAKAKWLAAALSFIGGLGAAATNYDDKVVGALAHLHPIIPAALGAAALGVAIADVADGEPETPAAYALFLTPLGFEPMWRVLNDDFGVAVICGIIGGIFALRPDEAGTHTDKLKWAAMALGVIGGFAFAGTPLANAASDWLPTWVLAVVGALASITFVVDIWDRKPNWMAAMSVYSMPLTLPATGALAAMVLSAAFGGN